MAEARGGAAVKRHGRLFAAVVDWGNLLRAARRAMRGKRDRAAVDGFNFALEPELFRLRDELVRGTYAPRPPAQFIIRDPKERLIGAPAFRDRVVHHAVCAVIEPILDRALIHDSYACRRGKGQHRALRRAREFARRSGWFLKLDIRQYFASIHCETLMTLLARKFKDRALLRLLASIVRPDDKPTGIPIGSLTSQVFANYYLNPLDHLVKEEWREPRYLRYMDDFVLFGDDPAHLKRRRRALTAFLGEELKLEINDRVAQLNRAGHGLPFLGFRVFPGIVRLRPRNARRYRTRLVAVRRLLAAGRLTEEAAARSFGALTEYVAQGDTWRFRRAALSDLLTGD